MCSTNSTETSLTKVFSDFISLFSEIEEFCESVRTNYLRSLFVFCVFTKQISTCNHIHRYLQNRPSFGGKCTDSAFARTSEGAGEDGGCFLELWIRQGALGLSEGGQCASGLGKNVIGVER